MALAFDMGSVTVVQGVQCNPASARVHHLPSLPTAVHVPYGTNHFVHPSFDDLAIVLIVLLPPHLHSRDQVRHPTLRPRQSPCLPCPNSARFSPEPDRLPRTVPLGHETPGARSRAGASLDHQPPLLGPRPSDHLHDSSPPTRPSPTRPTKRTDSWRLLDQLHSRAPLRLDSSRFPKPCYTKMSRLAYGPGPLQAVWAHNPRMRVLRVSFRSGSAGEQLKNERRRNYTEGGARSYALNPIRRSVACIIEIIG